MLKRVFAAALATAFFAVVTLPAVSVAQTTQTDKKDDTKKKKVKKAPSAKQKAARAKFSACAKSWGDHKKKTGEKGKKAYQNYMKGCLKKKDG